jgi:ribosomal protein S18 acetylase RimI-like enzyme
MTLRPEATLTCHDGVPPAEAAVIDHGLGKANEEAAPLHEVQALSCFARLASGTVIGGAVGRTWGPCCELQQLWVDPDQRRCGLGSRLVARFEAAAEARGCTTFYLETFSFQAPGFYRTLGYEVAYEHRVYPRGIVRYCMVRTIGPAQGKA